MDDAKQVHRVVDVRDRLDGTWTSGFALIETLVTPAGPRYRVKRISDGTIIWGLFTPDEVVLR
jgi:hypothetical protein